MKILIVAHDAGGAEIVSAWVKANPQHHYVFILEGPAIAIFSNKIVNLTNHNFETCHEILKHVERVLTGTSWASDLEKKVIKLCYEKKVFISTYLDHWVNYAERFIYDNQTYLPNEIWVGDTEAEIIAKDIFKKTPIRLEPNYYFLEVHEAYKKIKRIPANKKYNVLYICEPVRASDRHYNEFTALEYFFEQLRLNNYHQIDSVKLRLHPSEAINKYDHLVKRIKSTCSVEIEISQKTILLEDFAIADSVVGISSMALVIAEMLKKQVFVCIPPNAIVAQLPIKNINPIFVDKNHFRIVHFTKKHITPAYIAWLNDKEVVKYSELRHAYHTEKSCYDYWESFQGTPHFFWAIEIFQNGFWKHIGNINAYINKKNKIADIGILIGDKSVWGKGFGLIAWKAVCNYLLIECGMRKITGGTMHINEPMLKIMQRAGMKEDGRRLKQYVCDNEAVDICHYALFSDE